MINFLKNVKNIKSDRHGFKVNEPKVDYCILIPNDTALAIWYDSDDGITFKFIDDDYKYDVYCSSREQFVRIIKYNINTSERYTKVVSFVNNGQLDEDNFFMQSTVENFGEITYDIYKEVQRIYDEVMEIICDLEEGYDK